MSQTSAIPVPAVARPAREKRWFFRGMAVAAALTVFVGFARTYYLKDVFAGPPLTPLQHLHGFVFTAWIVLFLVQTWLVASQRTPLHRRLGVAGGVLAAVMVVVGLAASVALVRRGISPPGTPPAPVFVVVPIVDMVVFATLVGLALYFRRQLETHKRLMLLATISLLPAAIARWPGVLGTGPLVFFGLNDLFVVACWLYDFKSRGRVHPAFLWGGLLFIASQPLRLLLGNTDAWLAFAGWLAS